MYYQPQFHTTDKVLRGVEALIRWRDDNGKMISPAVFIPIAEKQYQYLNEINCDNIQGYFLGKPMPSDKLENLLADMTA